MSFLNKIYYKLFGQDIWRIGISSCDLSIVLDGQLPEQKIKWLDVNIKSDYEADPFIFKLSEVYYIAYEDFNYVSGNAKLKCIDLNGNEYPFFEEINKNVGHKSFPYVFEAEGELYCLPEEGDRNGLYLYRFNNGLSHFEFVRKVLCDDMYIDSFIHNLNGIYYLFTSTINEPFKQRLFYSDSLFSDFVEHKMSPIAKNSRVGRNGGGMLCCDDTLYRVSQNCTKTYGGSIVVSEVSHLSPDEYKENEYMEILPLSPYNNGIHTLSVKDEYIIFDGKKVKYRFSNVFRKLAYKLKIRLPFRN
ncbi:glucosamine inositolphosphorylceramide transferase family protein [Citrobacter braakii]|uniref:glucosamine inositolphosphorylceramide transferase family protein n=1 Tax=Citrobacter braakii TaxID=57706 RepID=UPI0039751020